MKKWNILILGLGYIAGLLVALKFAKPGENKNLEVLTSEIKDLHKNLWTETEKKIFSQENREKVAELKSKALLEIEAFKKDADKEIKRLLKEGNLKKAEITTEIKKLYEKREELIDSLIKETKELAESVRSESEDVGKLLSKKVDSIAKDLKKDLGRKFTLLKKKIK